MQFPHWQTEWKLNYPYQLEFTIRYFERMRMYWKNSLTTYAMRGKRIAKVCFLLYKQIVSLDSLSKSKWVIFTFLLLVWWVESTSFYLRRIFSLRFEQIFQIPFNTFSSGVVSPINHVPEHIIKPYYCTEVVKHSSSLQLKSEEDIVTMRRTCRLARKMLLAAESFITVRSNCWT